MSDFILAVVIICCAIYAIHKIFGGDDNDDMNYSAY